VAGKAEYAEVIPFIQENQAKFYRLAYGYVRNPDTALDLVQDAIVQALRKISTLRSPEYLKSWFYRILINECLMYLRKSKKVVLFEQLEEHIPAPEKPVDTVDALELLNAISHLEPMLQTIIFLRFYEDMKLEEIARATDANLNTVKSRLYKALRLLKLDMGEDE